MDNIKYKQFAFLLVLVVQFTLSAQHKHALIMAVGDYPEPNGNSMGWKDLSSKNDAYLVCDMLQKQLFPPGQIEILKDSSVTVQGIDRAMDALLNRVASGDMVYVHFSGHGQQVQDLNGDEEDGYDEALVCYDAPYSYFSGYRYERHYTDDRLKLKLDAIRRKLGPGGQVILVVDACYSGTMTRGRTNALVRGTGLKCAEPGYKPLKQQEDSLSFGIEQGVHNANMGSVYAFFGCRSYEENNEYTELRDSGTTAYGSLSYFLVKAMNSLADQASYRNLFTLVNRDIVIEFNDRQHPVMEARDPGQLIFGAEGNFIRDEGFFNILGNINLWSKTYNFTFDGGSLNGITAGDTIGIFDAGILSPVGAKPLAQALVYEVNTPMSSKARLIGVASHGKLKTEGANYKVFRLSGKTLPVPMKVFLDMSKKSKAIFREAIVSSGVTNLALVEAGYQYQISQEQSGPYKGYFALYKWGDTGIRYKSMLPVAVNKPEEAVPLVRELVNAGKIDFFRKLQVDHPDVRFSLNIHALRFDKNGKWQVDRSFVSDLTQGKVDSAYAVDVVNRSKSLLYVYVLNIRKDQTIELFREFFTCREQDYMYLQPGDSCRVAFQLDKPGFDQYVFMASTQPLNLRPVIEMGASSGAIAAYHQFFNSVVEKPKTRDGGETERKVSVRSLGVNVLR